MPQDKRPDYDQIIVELNLFKSGRRKEFHIFDEIEILEFVKNNKFYYINL
jgi:hypothetical protein